MGAQIPAIYRFGLFEVDPRAGEVRKSGVRIKLQDQPLQVLLKLLEQPGTVVSRETLRSALWQDDTFVDFDAGLNTAIRRLRDTLGDAADNPTLIETVPRRGYRFIAPVETLPYGPTFAASARAAVSEAQLAPERGPEIGEAHGGDRARLPFRRWVWITLGCGGLALAVAALLFGVRTAPAPDGPLRFTQLTDDGVAKSGPLLTDGTRIYFSEITPKQRVLVQVGAPGGEAAPVPTELGSPRQCSISADGSEMLVLAGEGESPLPLWSIPVAGGSPRQVGGIVASDAVWRPDGQRLAYAVGHDIFLAEKDGAGSRKLLTTRGFPSGLCWSPDQKRLRFHTWEPVPVSLTLWEVGEDGRDVRPLLPSSFGQSSSSSGAWSRANGTFFFTAVFENRTDVWAMPGRSFWRPWASAAPVRVTSGPLAFSAPTVNPRNPRELFVLGTAPRAELVRLDSSTGRFLPYLAGVSAEGVDFSKDGKWIAFTSYPDGALWRCRTGGDERRQLTFSPVRAFMPRWSPDGDWIAFVDVSKEPWTIRLISSGGTDMKQVSPPGEAASDPTWAPTGDRIALGGVDLTHSDEPSGFVIRTLDLASGRINALPGSAGLFSPRWSPDGGRMAAINAASELAILDLRTGDRFTLQGFKAGFPCWSRAGDFVYFQDRTNTEVPGHILRMKVATHEVETVVELDKIGRLPLGTFTSWSGLAPDDSPLLSRDISVQEIYSIRW